MKKLLIIFFLSILVPSFANPFMPSGLDFGGEMPTEVAVRNRILLKVTGKPVSVMDITKKMDLLFYRQFPEMASSVVARYQFYMANFNAMLTSVIEDHMVLADAEEKKITVSDGDVREEMESLFGPDVVLNIDSMGLTFEDVWKLLKTELTVKKMSTIMVRSKAIAEVTPKQIRQRYEEIVQENPGEDKWRYQVLTIRSSMAEEAQRVTQAALSLLNEQNCALEMLVEEFDDDSEIVKVSLSEEYERSDRELSLAHRAVLQTLEVGAHSSPIVQESKKGNEEIVRIFVLKEHEKGEPISFRDAEDKIHAELTQKAMVRHSISYLEKLRQQYGITDSYLKTMIPDDFVPFELK